MCYLEAGASVGHKDRVEKFRNNLSHTTHKLKNGMEIESFWPIVGPPTAEGDVKIRAPSRQDIASAFFELDRATKAFAPCLPVIDVLLEKQAAQVADHVGVDYIKDILSAKDQPNSAKRRYQQALDAYG